MNAPAGSFRAPRSRILAVGHASILEGSEFADRGVEFAASMYEAIGTIASSTAAEPIEMVIIDERAANHSLEVIAESIHRLDPGVLVYLAVRPDRDGSARRRALAARFDGAIELPITPDVVEASMTDPAVSGVRPPAAAPRIDEPDVNGEIDAGIQVDREFETARNDASETIAAPFLPLRAPSEMPPLPTESTIEPLATSPSPGGLGDVDIVEAMLDDPARGIKIALLVIEQETAWQGVRFTPTDDPAEGSIAPSGASAPVSLRGRVYGWLSAEGARAGALEPWAAWLARWAALAASQRELLQAAQSDSLTGAGNRRAFNEFLPRILEEAKQKRRQIPVMVFDVDNLKHFNDRHGHDAGDTVLRETVRLLRSIIRRGDQIFRIGGDEFVVVFADPDPPRKPGSGVIESVETIARRFQTEICAMNFPKLGHEAPGTLSISAGLATYPWDGGDAETLVRVADQLALDSKRGGKNALTIGPGAATRCTDGELEGQ